MTLEPHDSSRSKNPILRTGGPWTLLDILQEAQERAVESPEDLANAKNLLGHCLVTFAESEKSRLSGEDILNVLFECVGPGRRISVCGEGLAEAVSQKIGHGIPTDDGKCQEFRVGNTWYRFRAEFGMLLEGRPESDGTWTFGAADETFRFLGRGQSREAATDNWRHLVHTRFQQLVRSRPFRMSEDEKADWAILSELIDVEHYWKTTPFRHHETGWISAVSSGVWEITWLGVDGTESIGVEKVPDEFAGYQKDQWFEALVERDRDSFALQRIIDSREIDPIEDMTDEEVEAWFSSLPTTETLPKSDTDWNTL